MNTGLLQDRCAKSDYLDLFTNSAEPLHWLCFTLTGDRNLSERVLEAALEQSLKGADRVFREWMLSWARRLIIKACAELMKPWKSDAVAEFEQLFPIRLKAVDRDRANALVNVPSQLLQGWLLQLEPLCRFVFVLRAIEGYTRRDTSLLLNIDDRLCEWAYIRAVSTIEAFCGTETSHRAWTFRNGQEFCLAQAGD
jgi:DNA-directed RNA polymerase specialized sigma24 family protein